MNIKIKTTLYALAFSILYGSAFADEALILTADDAVNAALSNNLGLATEKISTLVKERTKDMSWGVLIPKVTVGATLSRLNQDPTMSFRTTSVPPGFEIYTPAHTFNISGSLNATWILTPQIIYGIQQTYLDYESGKISYDIAEKKLDRDVRKSFYSLLLMEQSIRLMEKSIQSAKTRFDQAGINFKNGLVDQYTMLAAQVTYENMKPALAELNNGYVTSLLSFKFLLGVDLDKEIKLSGSLEDIKPITLDEKKLVDTYLDKRLDLKNLDFSLKSMENARDMLQSSLYPTLSLILSFDPAFQKDPFANSWFADINNDWKQRSGMFGITLSMSLDSFLPFSKTQTDIANAQSNVEKMKLSLAQAKTGAELEIRSLVLKLRKSEESLATLSLNVSLAEKANAMGQDAYKAGLKDYSQIGDTEYQLQNAQFNILKEKFNYISSLYDLAFSLSTTAESIKK